MPTSADYLQKLSSGAFAARVGGAPKRGLDPTNPDEIDFASLLQQARSGQIKSGREVKVSDDLGITLSDAQRTRLAAAADLAEAHGAQQAVIMLDGVGLKLDVATRTVTGRVDASSPGVASGVDAVVVAPPEEIELGKASTPANANAGAETPVKGTRRQLLAGLGKRPLLTGL
jgi:hypothetical protein